jgi:hypothetical protein
MTGVILRNRLNRLGSDGEAPLTPKAAGGLTHTTPGSSTPAHPSPWHGSARLTGPGSRFTGASMRAAVRCPGGG